MINMFGLIWMVAILLAGAIYNDIYNKKYEL